MYDVQEFMQEFVRAERALHRHLAELEKAMWASFAKPGLHQTDFIEYQAKWDEHVGLESSESDGEKGTAIAAVRHHSSWPTRARYSLRRTGGDWRICGIEYFCKVCNGTGLSHKGEACTICHGRRYFTPPEFTQPKAEIETNILPDKYAHPPGEGIDDFMHSFLCAERMLYNAFTKLEEQFQVSFGSPPLVSQFAKIHSDWENLTNIETFDPTEAKTTVIASVVRESQTQVRNRYSLRNVDSHWCITGLEHACPCCNGKGVAVVSGDGGESQERSCFVCRGKGWMQPKPSAGSDTNTIHRG